VIEVTILKVQLAKLKWISKLKYTSKAYICSTDSGTLYFTVADSDTDRAPVKDQSIQTSIIKREDQPVPTSMVKQQGMYASLKYAW